VTLRSMTSAFSCAIRTRASIQDRDTGAGYRVDALLHVAGRATIGDKANVDPAVMGADQRRRDATASREDIGRNKNFVMGGVDSAEGKQGAILLGREAGNDGRRQGGNEQSGWHAPTLAAETSRSCHSAGSIGDHRHGVNLSRRQIGRGMALVCQPWRPAGGRQLG